MMIVNVLLAIIAYAAIISSVVIFVRGSYHNSRNQEYNQRPDRDCDDNLYH